MLEMFPLVCMQVDTGLYLANVGDCRAVVCDDGEARALTRDHKPGSNDMEMARLQNAGENGSEVCRCKTWYYSIGAARAFWQGELLFSHSHGAGGCVSTAWHGIKQL